MANWFISDLPVRTPPVEGTDSLVLSPFSLTTPDEMFRVTFSDLMGSTIPEVNALVVQCDTVRDLSGGVLSILAATDVTINGTDAVRITSVTGSFYLTMGTEAVMYAPSTNIGVSNTTAHIRIADTTGILLAGDTEGIDVSGNSLYVDTPFISLRADTTTMWLAATEPYIHGTDFRLKATTGWLDVVSYTDLQLRSNFGKVTVNAESGDLDLRADDDILVYSGTGNVRLANAGTGIIELESATTIAMIGNTNITGNTNIIGSIDASLQPCLSTYTDVDVTPQEIGIGLQVQIPWDGVAQRVDRTGMLDANLYDVVFQTPGVYFIQMSAYISKPTTIAGDNLQMYIPILTDLAAPYTTPINIIYCTTNVSNYYFNWSTSIYIPGPGYYGRIYAKNNSGASRLAYIEKGDVNYNRLLVYKLP